MRFENLADEWLSFKKGCIKDSTYALYRYEIDKYLYPALQSRAVKRFSKSEFQRICNGINQQKQLSASTKRNIVVLLKQIVGYGINCGYIKPFTMKVLKTVTFQPNLIKTVQYDDLEQLISLLYQTFSFKNVAILLAVYEGLRIGEICALRWTDINLQDKTITVNKTLQRIYKKEGSQLVISSPKSQYSERLLPLNDNLYALIMKHAEDICPDGYFATNSSIPLEPRSLRRYYNRLCSESGINGLHFHSLRHTFATNCIENGFDCKIISELLGHSSINITLDLYVHPSFTSKARCINSLK